MRPQETHRISNLVIVCGHDPTLSRSNILGRVEAETAGPEGPGWRAMVGRTQRLCAILNQPQTSSLGQLKDLVHRSGMPKKRDRHDRASPRGECRRDLTDVAVELRMVHVN